jgi:hypothetical protein
LRAIGTTSPFGESQYFAIEHELAALLEGLGAR